MKKNAGVKRILSRIAAKGWLIISAMASEAISVTERATGIDRMKLPIMPDVKSRGRKAQTVVSVVEVSTTLKSFNTKRIASSGVNFPVRIYILVAETTTMASSTIKPSDKSKAKVERKFKEIPARFITPKVTKKTKGMAKPATNASLRPTIKIRTPITKMIVRMKSWVSWLKSSLIYSDWSSVTSYFNPGFILTYESSAIFTESAVLMMFPPVLFTILIATASEGKPPDDDIRE